jgi:hypothetical protein
VLLTLKKIWLETISKFGFFNWVTFALFYAVVVAIIVCQFTGATYYTQNLGWCFLAPGVLLFIALLGPVLRIAREERERGIRVVLFWGLVGLLVFIATFVMAYNVFVGEHSTYDRLLNVVPAVIAVWAASLGWYTHHQITMKGARTAHAFNLIMQMQTNAEYCRNLRAFSQLYPVGSDMPEQTPECDQFYGSDAIRQLPALEARLANPSNAEDRLAAADTIRKIEANLAAKYLMNYFEFMARGVKSGDLDDGVLYDTIGPTVTRFYRRTKNYRVYLQTGHPGLPGQPLAMQFLDPLVVDWEDKTRKEEANIVQQSG